MLGTGIALLCLSMCDIWCDGRPTGRDPDPVNDRPIIGIITQEVTDDVMKPFGKTYIPSSYVKYLESAGSRVVPIRLTHTTAEYEAIFKSINGLLFIGGSVDLANDAGDFFPVWGTCMGLQLLACLVAGENVLSDAQAMNVALPLNLTAEARSSQMFRDFPRELMTALTHEPLTANFHLYGVTEKVFRGNERLRSFFSILSTNVAVDGTAFVSTMEGKAYPFYAVQWHPEVNRFQWSPKANVPHSANAVSLSALLAQFFINQGRKSFHSFSQPEEEAASLIYQYTPTYAANFTKYQQIYFF